MLSACSNRNPTRAVDTNVVIIYICCHGYKAAPWDMQLCLLSRRDLRLASSSGISRPIRVIAEEAMEISVPKILHHRHTFKPPWWASAHTLKMSRKTHNKPRGAFFFYTDGIHGGGSVDISLSRFLSVLDEVPHGSFMWRHIYLRHLCIWENKSR